MSYIFIILIFGLLFYLKKNQATILGVIGEYQVSKVLRNIHSSFLVMNDLLLPREDRTTSQIDHIVITSRGIFVIETKNYAGKIYGSERAKQWKVYYKKGGKEYSLYNPIHQNYGHIKSLERILISYPQIPYYSIVVFSNVATLNITTTTPVILYKDLEKTIQNIYQQNKDVLSEKEMQQIRRRIKLLNNNSNKKKKQHIQQVRKSKGS